MHAPALLPPLRKAARHHGPQPGSRTYLASEVVKAIRIYDRRKKKKLGKVIKSEVSGFRARGRETCPGEPVPPCRTGVALSPGGSPSSKRAESTLRKASGAASQAGESSPSPGFGAASSTFPPANTRCAGQFFCRASSPSNGETAARTLGKWVSTALKLSLERGAP